jgi:hypothetical protein
MYGNITVILSPDVCMHKHLKTRNVSYYKLQRTFIVEYVRMITNDYWDDKDERGCGLFKIL